MPHVVHHQQGERVLVFLNCHRGNNPIFVSLRPISPPQKKENLSLVSRGVTKQTPVGVFTSHEGGEVSVYLHLAYCHISYEILLSICRFWTWLTCYSLICCKKVQGRVTNLAFFFLPQFLKDGIPYMNEAQEKILSQQLLGGSWKVSR